MVKSRTEPVVLDGVARVYGLHWSGGHHYVGFTTLHVSTRVHRHLLGRGSRYVFRMAQEAGAPTVGFEVECPTIEAAVYLERGLKGNWPLVVRMCRYCGGKDGEGEV